MGGSFGCLRNKKFKNRRKEEYVVDNPIAKYDPEIVEQALCEVRK